MSHLLTIMIIMKLIWFFLVTILRMKVSAWCISLGYIFQVREKKKKRKEDNSKLQCVLWPKGLYRTDSMNQHSKTGKVDESFQDIL